MHAAGRGGFQVVPADGTVDQRADPLRVHTALRQSLFNGLDADAPRQDPLRPEPPLADPGHEFEPARRKAQTVINRRKALLDRVGRDDFIRKQINDRFNANVFIVHFSKSEVKRVEPERTGLKPPSLRGVARRAGGS